MPWLALPAAGRPNKWDVDGNSAHPSVVVTKGHGSASASELTQFIRINHNHTPKE